MQKQPNMRQVKRIAVIYIKTAAKKGHIPNYEEINKQFGIRNLRITTKELYLKAGLNFLELTQVKRPNRSTDILKKELIAYLIKCKENEHYPSRRELEHQFNIRLSMFKNIKDLYRKARVPYKQIHNQAIKVKKAKLLEKIVINNLKKLNVTLISKSGISERGIDLICKDKAGRIIGVELKAYNKYEIVKKRNIKQIETWLKTRSFHKIILITTTSKIENKVKIPKNVEIIKFEGLIKICNKNSFKKLQYIRDYSIHIDTKEHKIKRDLIKDHVRHNYKDNERLNVNEISTILKLDIYTYFKNQLELYKYCNLMPPLCVIRGRRRENKGKLNLEYSRMWKSKIVSYIKEEIYKGRYPSGTDINKKFNISHIWNYLKVSKLYKTAGFKPYHERLPRFKVLTPLNVPPST